MDGEGENIMVDNRAGGRVPGRRDATPWRQCQVHGYMFWCSTAQ